MAFEQTCRGGDEKREEHLRLHLADEGDQRDGVGSVESTASPNGPRNKGVGLLLSRHPFLVIAWRFVTSLVDVDQ